MSRQSSRHSSLFLLELIAAIFFFCLASAVCIRFFVKSHTLNEDTKALDMAVNQSASLAEEFRAEDDLLTFLKTQFPNGSISEDGYTYTIYYDDNWEPCSKENGDFTLDASVDKSYDISSAELRVYKTGSKEKIYSLDLKKYVPEEAGYER